MSSGFSQVALSKNKKDKDGMGKGALGWSDSEHRVAGIESWSQEVMCKSRAIS